MLARRSIAGSGAVVFGDGRVRGVITGSASEAGLGAAVFVPPPGLAGAVPSWSAADISHARSMKTLSAKRRRFMAAAPLALVYQRRRPAPTP